MEYTSDFIGLVMVFSGLVTLLNIILFFKIWGMTNNTAKIKNILQEWLDLEHPKIDKVETQNKK